MKYKKIEITEEHKNYFYHVTPLANLESIKRHGLIRPDILRKNKGIVHVSPYDAFITTKKFHVPTEEKDAYTYFGIWENGTFHHWKHDQSVVDKCIIFRLKDTSLLVEDYDINKLGRFRSKEECIPFQKFTLISFVSDKEKMDKQETPYCLLKTDSGFELYELNNTEEEELGIIF